VFYFDSIEVLSIGRSAFLPDSLAGSLHFMASLCGWIHLLTVLVSAAI